MDNLTFIHNLYEDTAKWLTFAEAKHVALITLMSFIITALLDKFSIFKSVPQVMIYTLIGLSILIILISISSFIPFFNLRKALIKASYNHYKPQNTRNVLFYISIFCMSQEGIDTYEEALVQKMLATNNSFNNIEKEYIHQIKDLSTVASIKYYLFEKAMLLFFINVVLFLTILIHI